MQNSELRARLVQYDELVPCTTAFIDTRTPGSELKENFTIIGPGVAENPDQHVHIKEPHGFNIGGARQPPGCVNSQHSHETEEVFVVHSGTWAFRTGEHGSDGEVILEEGDVISIPTHVFRGFENVGDGQGFLFAVLGGDDPGHVTWAPYVFDAAKEYGLVLLESGRLIDTAAGETVPDGEAPQSPTTAEMVEALTVVDSEGLNKCIARQSELSPAANGFYASEGILESPIIGQACKESSDTETPAGKLAWPHDFQLKRLDFSAGSATREYTRDIPEVWFVQEGHVSVNVDGELLSMGAGDVFTVPVGAARKITNDSASNAGVYVVLGSNQPVARVA